MPFVAISGNNFEFLFPSSPPLTVLRRGNLPRPNRAVAVGGRHALGVRLVQRHPGQCQPISVVQLGVFVADGRPERKFVPGNAQHSLPHARDSPAGGALTRPGHWQRDGREAARHPAADRPRRTVSFVGVSE